MPETQLEIAPLGTRERVEKSVATVAVTDTADTVHTEAVVFDKPFVKPPTVFGINAPVAGTEKGVLSATDITTVGMNVNIYQIALGDLATADHQVTVSLVGWHV